MPTARAGGKKVGDGVAESDATDSGKSSQFEGGAEHPPVDGVSQGLVVVGEGEAVIPTEADVHHSDQWDDEEEDH